MHRSRVGSGAYVTGTELLVDGGIIGELMLRANAGTADVRLPRISQPWTTPYAPRHPSNR
ncbi:hypothetical protein [Cupriavidus sp. PET2-C1]